MVDASSGSENRARVLHAFLLLPLPVLNFKCLHSSVSFVYDPTNDGSDSYSAYLRLVTATCHQFLYQVKSLLSVLKEA